MMRRPSFLLLLLGAIIGLVAAEDFVFINPPASNVFTDETKWPSYTQGSTIEIIWTANSSFDPITIALRASTDGILSPSSGIQGSILSGSNTTNTSWTVESNLPLSKHPTYYLAAISPDESMWATSTYFNISAAPSSSSSSSSSSTSSSKTSSSTTAMSSFTAGGITTTPTSSPTSSPTSTPAPAPTKSEAVPIAVGVTVPVVVIAVAVIAFCLFRRRRNRQNGFNGNAQPGNGNGSAWQQNNGQNVGGYYGGVAPKQELDTQFSEVREMDGTTPGTGRVHELG